VTVHAKRDIKAIFCSTPPHLKKEDDDKFSDFDSLYLDTGLSGVIAKELISVGDRVSAVAEPVALLNGQIAAKSLDDRAGCAALIFVAKQIAERGVPPVTVTIALSAQEELGGRGAKTAAFSSQADEAIAVDVSFGFSSDLSAEKCGKLGEGPMLGVSPVLSKEIANKLLEVSKKLNMPIQFEGMGGTTSTNADVIGVTKSGIKCGLLSIPLKNMHTTVEIVTVADVVATANLITEYIFEGGIYNA
jgi:putative aminopeptidase FrvX